LKIIAEKRRQKKIRFKKFKESGGDVDDFERYDEEEQEKELMKKDYQDIMKK
jgi:hypothetical protein